MFAGFHAMVTGAQIISVFFLEVGFFEVVVRFDECSLVDTELDS